MKQPIITKEKAKELAKESEELYKIVKKRVETMWKISKEERQEISR